MIVLCSLTVSVLTEDNLQFGLSCFCQLTSESNLNVLLMQMDLWMISTDTRICILSCELMA